MAEMSSSGLSPSTLFARVSPEDILVYANRAFAEYLAVSKDTLIGTPLDVVTSRLGPEIAQCFSRESPTGGRSGLVADSGGRVFEAVTHREGGFLDVVLNEVTPSAGVAESFEPGISVKSGELDEEEIRTIWHPERRTLSVSMVRLCGFEEYSASAPPLQARIVLNLFVEEGCDAVLGCGGAIGNLDADRVQGIHGAPRHYANHAWRAVRSWFCLERRMSALRREMTGSERRIPLVAGAVSSGEDLLATLNAPTGNRYSTSGAATALAGQLCRLARPGELLVSEFTLEKLMESAPDGWEFLRADTENSPDLSDVLWSGDEIQPLPADKERVVWLVGPGVRENHEAMEFYLDYLYAVKASGYDEPVPVLRVTSFDGGLSELDLSQNQAVASRVVQVLGKYKLIQVIGQGGMGKVWRAEDRFGNAVAIKVLNSGEMAGDEAIRRFRREAEIMGRLDHHNICRIFELGEYEGIQFLAMQFIEGITLADLLYEGMQDGKSRVDRVDLRTLIRSLRGSRGDEDGPEDAQQPVAETSGRPLVSRILPVEQTLSIFGKICDAVQFAHEHGVLHRDLKPGNVLLRADGEPVVADFGLAKAADSTGGMSISVSGTTLGTIENMAPEQAESSKEVDERADVYSLGTILYQMLTGRRHFEASGNVLADAQRLRQHEPPKPRSLNPSLDPDLECICLKAMRPDPAGRYRNVAALQADIERYRRNETIMARPVGSMETLRKVLVRHRVVAGVICLALLALSMVAAFSFWQINLRRIDAENALAAAEDAARRADAALVEARESRAEAEQRRVEAEGALSAKTEALAALEKAVEEASRAKAGHAAASIEKDRAEQESLQQKEARERAEAAAKALEQELEKARTAGDAGAPDPSEPRPAAEPDPAFVKKAALAAESSLRDAESRFASMFDPVGMFRSQRQPKPSGSTDMLRILDGATRAIAGNPGNPRARLLKARMHLLLGEFKSTRDELSEIDTALPGPHSIHDREFPPMMVPRHEIFSLMDLSERAESERWNPERLGQELEKAGIRDGMTMASMLRASTGGGSKAAFPDNRKPLSSELILETLRTNAPANAVVLIDDAGGDGKLRLEIEGGAGLGDLSPLQGADIGELRLRGLDRIDWKSLSGMNPKVLKIEQSVCEPPPTAGAGGFSRLVEADFSGTPLPSADFLRGCTALEILNLSGSRLQSFPQLETRKLRFLNLDSANLPEIRRLLGWPLEELVLSPEMTANPSALHFLRFHKTLRSVRVPGDPPGQSAEEFWNKLEAGAYQ